ncbi:outer membrane lipoprotein chaperone LolA [Chromatiaceae bacterium AAb-1]|nr:outer membrane lipoprotein chaperone LolA [Chromatiaceae bacterium AAb-1]
MRNYVFGFFLLFTALSVQAAESAAQRLQQKLAAINSFQAAFNQQVFDQQQQLLQQGKGQLYLKQPAFFRFETTEPEPNLFIGDGTNLWYFNELLEQLSIYDAEREVNRTPFVLLTSREPALWEQYQVSEQQGQFLIRSLDENAPVQQLILTFAGAALSQMQVLDINQQRSVFDFIAVQLNIPVSAQLFQFEAGPEIDIDDQRQQP